MKRYYVFYKSGILLLCLLLAGCVTTQKQSSTPPTPAVSKLTFEQMTTYVAQQKGKVLLVNFWATWCDPCVEELPDLIKLYQAHHAEGLDMVGFSVDFPDQTNKVVKPFVKKNKIPYPIYVANPDDQDILINYFSKEWSGTVPATFLYDPSGKLIKIRLTKMSYAEMEEFIKPGQVQKKDN